MNFTTRYRHWLPVTGIRLPILLLAVLCGTLLAPGLRAADIDEQNRQGLGEDFWEKYDDITDWVTLRLELTPMQEESVLPILSENFQKSIDVLKSYGFRLGYAPELSREQAEEIDAKIIAIRADTRAKLVSQLNEEQLETLKEIQREFHQDFRQRLAKLRKDGKTKQGG